MLDEAWASWSPIERSSDWSPSRFLSYHGSARERSAPPWTYTMDVHLHDTLLNAFRAAELGDFDVLLGAKTQLARRSDPVALAWLWSFDALHRMSTARAGNAIDVQLPDSVWHAGSQVRLAASYGCRQLQLQSLLHFQQERLRHWSDQLRQLSVEAPEPRQQAWLLMSQVWLALMADRLDEAAVKTKALSGLVTEHKLADGTVEVTTQRALLHARRGELSEATALARRASRMARTEGILQQEYLANLVLARIRRHAGRNHLAVRILSALSAVVPWPWRNWVQWESLMAGGTVTKAVDGELARAAAAFVEAVDAGDQPRFRQCAQHLMQQLSGWCALEEEAHVLVEGLDAGASAGSTLAPWAGGRVDHAPYYVRGPPGGGSSLALVASWPGRAPRRILRAGEAFVVSAGAPWIQGDPRQKDNRVQTALAVLALAGADGLRASQLFELVYGFAYVQAKHENILRVLIHRSRRAVAGAADVRRDADRLTFVPHRAVLIPDPRCAPTLEERVLDVLASFSHQASAQDVADHLAVPVRTVRAALKALQMEGACVMDRAGRNTSYRVEDTTFYEPSLTRLSAKD